MDQKEYKERRDTNQTWYMVDEGYLRRRYVEISGLFAARAAASVS